MSRLHDPSHAPFSPEQKNLRDLMGLLALPALWADSDGPTVIRRMMEAIERIVPIRIGRAVLDYLPEQPPLCLLYVRGGPIEYDTTARDYAWFAEGCDSMDGDRAKLRGPDGTPLYVMCIQLSMGVPSGKFWFASNRADFPTSTQSSFIRAAVSLASNGLHAARLAYEREQASRAKDEFLAMLGHELRNPLAPIVTALNVIELKSQEPLSREHAIIRRQVAHLSRLVDDLLDVTRVTRGMVELRKTPVEIRSVLVGAVESVSPLLEERRHTLDVGEIDEETVVNADPGRMHQIFVNLLSNAAKYTNREGHITISASRRGDEVEIVIRDNGDGIDPELLPRIFGLFEQGTLSTRQPKSGLGIGLALVKALVEMHDGRVLAHSEGSDRGSEFRVVLPAWVPEPEPVSEPEIAALPVASADSVRVMLVDDNEDALEMLELVLSAKGYQVTTTQDPTHALELASAFQPDIALLDIGMPVMDGYELAQTLKQTLGHRAPRLIALTGYGQIQDRERALAAGFDEHLVKPVNVDALLEALAEAHPR